MKLDYSIFAKYNPYNKKVVSYVGNVGSAQGLESMLVIAKRHEDLLFLICGSGKEIDKIKRCITEECISNVILTGEISKKQALAVTKLSFASYISLQSTSMLDSIPTKLYESLAVGTPVFLVAAGEACEILKNSKLGICAEPNDMINIINSFNDFLVNYNQIICNKNYSIEYISKNHSRQIACKLVLELINNYVN